MARGHMPSCSSGCCRSMCEDGPIASVAALQQVLAEESGSAYAPPGGDGAIVARRLAVPGVQCAEGKESG